MQNIWRGLLLAGLAILAINCGNKGNDNNDFANNPYGAYNNPYGMNNPYGANNPYVLNNPCINQGFYQGVYDPASGQYNSGGANCSGFQGNGVYNYPMNNGYYNGYNNGYSNGFSGCSQFGSGYVPITGNPGLGCTNFNNLRNSGLNPAWWQHNRGNFGHYQGGFPNNYSNGNYGLGYCDAYATYDTCSYWAPGSYCSPQWGSQGVCVY